MTKLNEFIEQHNEALPKIVKAEIAERAGIAPSELSRVLRGLIPSEEVKVRIVAALRECTGKDVTVAEFWPTQPAEAGR